MNNSLAHTALEIVENMTHENMKNFILDQQGWAMGLGMQCSTEDPFDLDDLLAQVWSVIKVDHSAVFTQAFADERDQEIEQDRLDDILQNECAEYLA